MLVAWTGVALRPRRGDERPQADGVRRNTGRDQERPAGDRRRAPPRYRRLLRGSRRQGSRRGRDLRKGGCGGGEERSSIDDRKATKVHVDSVADGGSKRIREIEGSSPRSGDPGTSTNLARSGRATKRYGTAFVLLLLLGGLQKGKRRDGVYPSSSSFCASASLRPYVQFRIWRRLRAGPPAPNRQRAAPATATERL